ncbi:MAG: hypothetical protein QOD99_2525 [Chthoniobacter sp.]|jgi:general secretion pathway protein I|nr:hypothetical protein [Chthoniobacter sp.]
MNRHSGFTLVEVLAALAFLAILLPVVLSALSISNRAAVVAERRSLASELAENQLSQLILSNAWATGDTRGDFGVDRPGYRWELKRGDWTSGLGMSELTMNVFYQVQGREGSVTLVTLANEALTTGTAP